jgi:small subunit ribosomal protein S16
MLAIRFKRTGRKHQPSFRIVVAEKRSKRDGRAVEDIGFYNPISKEFNIKKERVDYWLKVGAKPTITVWNLLVKHKVINAPKIPVKIKKSNKPAEELSQTQTQAQTSSSQEQLNEVNQESSNESADKEIASVSSNESGSDKQATE